MYKIEKRKRNRSRTLSCKLLKGAETNYSKHEQALIGHEMLMSHKMSSKN